MTDTGYIECKKCKERIELSLNEASLRAYQNFIRKHRKCRKCMETTMTEELYPCQDCGKMRSKDEGGTVFTVCDDCWDKAYNPGNEKV